MLESFVYARLPRGGLGNKLLVWARALVFARQNGLTLYVSGWADIKIGPYLRGERSKRQYWSYFKDNYKPSLLQRFMFSFIYSIQHEPNLEDGIYPHYSKTGQLYIFDTVPSWHDYFIGLRGHEEFVRSAFLNLLKPSYHQVLSGQINPIIGVHVRRSDFRDLRPGESIGQNCNVRTPISYYLKIIYTLRRMTGRIIPVTVFTDGRPEDVAELLALPEVTLAAQNPDIVDLILLSKSKCLVTSAGSTFSYLAAYLSNGVVITHPKHKVNIRSQSDDSYRYEGSISDNQRWDPALVKYMDAISSEL